MTATVASRSNAQGIVNKAILNITTDAVAAVDTTFNVGFVPRYVRWINKATMLNMEYFDGMAAGTAYRATAGGAQTLDVAPAGITVNALGVTIKAADIPISSAFLLIAEG